MTIGATNARPFLEIKDLSVRFETDDGIVQAVSESSFSRERGKKLGIVGESGSGKSVPSLAIPRVNPPTASRAWGA